MPQLKTEIFLPKTCASPSQKGWVETTFSHSFSLSPAVMRRYARRRSSQVYPKQRPCGTARLANSELQFQQWRAQVVVAPSSRGSAEPEARRFFGACVRACVCAARVWTPEVGAGLWFPAAGRFRPVLSDFLWIKCRRRAERGEEGGRFGNLPRTEHGSGSRYGFLSFFGRRKTIDLGLEKIPKWWWW